MSAQTRAKVFKILWIVSSFVTGLIASKNETVAKLVTDVVTVVITP